MKSILLKLCAIFVMIVGMSTTLNVGTI